MLLFGRHIEQTRRLSSGHCGIHVTQGLSLDWVSSFAVTILSIAAITSLLAFAIVPFVQISSSDYQPISTTLFLNIEINNSHIPRFSGYRFALWYDFGRWLAQQVVWLFNRV